MFEWPCSTCREKLEAVDATGEEVEGEGGPNWDVACVAGGPVDEFKAECEAADFDAYKLEGGFLTHDLITGVYSCLCDYFRFLDEEKTVTCDDLDTFMSG